MLSKDSSLPHKVRAAAISLREGTESQRSRLLGGWPMYRGEYPVPALAGEDACPTRKTPGLSALCAPCPLWLLRFDQQHRVGPRDLAVAIHGFDAAVAGIGQRELGARDAAAIAPKSAAPPPGRRDECD